MGEGEIGPTDILEGGERVGAATVPSAVEMRGKELEPAASDIGDQRVTIAKVAIGGGRADPGRACGIGKGKPCWAFFCDQVEGRLDQRLAQIAVVIAAPSARPLSRPAHVKCFYIKSKADSRRIRRQDRVDRSRASMIYTVSATCIDIKR